MPGTHGVQFRRAGAGGSTSPMSSATGPSGRPSASGAGATGSGRSVRPISVSARRGDARLSLGIDHRRGWPEIPPPRGKRGIRLVAHLPDADLGQRSYEASRSLSLGSRVTLRWRPAREAGGR